MFNVFHVAGNLQQTSSFLWKKKIEAWVSVEAYSIDANESGDKRDKTEISTFQTSARYEFCFSYYKHLHIK